MSRKVTIALATALLAGIVGACAKPAEQSRLLARGVTVADLRAAPDTVVAAGSARFEVRLGAASSDGNVVATGGFAGQQVSVELDLASVLARAAAATPGVRVPVGPDTMRRGSGDGTSGYLQVPMLLGPGGATGWLSLTPGDLGSVGDSLGMAVNVFDPSKVLEVLREVTEGMQVVGADVVRGVATTHVRATTSATTAAMTPPGGVIDVWIDRAGLVRRVQMAADGLPVAGSDGGDEIVTIELFDYGESVEITVPAASEITPFSDLLGSFAGAGA